LITLFQWQMAGWPPHFLAEHGVLSVTAMSCFHAAPVVVSCCCCLLCAGWSRNVTVEAFVVNVKDAAAPDVAGLVNPLLNRSAYMHCVQLL
jgi:hypothetical protein